MQYSLFELSHGLIDSEFSIVLAKNFGYLVEFQPETKLWLFRIQVKNSFEVSVQPIKTYIFVRSEPIKTYIFSLLPIFLAYIFLKTHFEAC